MKIRDDYRKYIESKINKILVENDQIRDWLFIDAPVDSLVGDIFAWRLLVAKEKYIHEYNWIEWMGDAAVALIDELEEVLPNHKFRRVAIECEDPLGTGHVGGTIHTGFMLALYSFGKG